MRFPRLAGLFLTLFSSSAFAKPRPPKLDLKVRAPVAAEIVRARPCEAQRDWMTRAGQRLLDGPLAFMSSVPADRVDALAAGLIGWQRSF
ncbi:MAG TPA: hypothetical protein VFF06_15075 [Polyangia bacterium]|nr:hypothetical protein [Polyangia bacterium]